jgi:hypothetical protein
MPPTRGLESSQEPRVKNQEESSSGSGRIRIEVGIKGERKALIFLK